MENIAANFKVIGYKLLWENNKFMMGDGGRVIRAEKLINWWANNDAGWSLISVIMKLRWPSIRNNEFKYEIIIEQETKITMQNAKTNFKFFVKTFLSSH